MLSFAKTLPLGRNPTVIVRPAGGVLVPNLYSVSRLDTKSSTDLRSFLVQPASSLSACTRARSPSQFTATFLPGSLVTNSVSKDWIDSDTLGGITLVRSFSASFSATVIFLARAFLRAAPAFVSCTLLSRSSK